MSNTPLGTFARFPKPLAERVIGFHDMGQNSEIVKLDLKNIDQKKIGQEINKIYNAYQTTRKASTQSGMVHLILMNKIPAEGQAGEENYDRYTVGFHLFKLYSDKKFGYARLRNEDKKPRQEYNYSNYHGASQYKSEYVTNFDKNMYDFYLVLTDRVRSAKSAARRKARDVNDRHFVSTINYRGSKFTFNVDKDKAIEILKKKFYRKKKELKQQAVIAIDELSKLSIDAPRDRDRARNVEDRFRSVMKDVDRIDSFLYNMNDEWSGLIKGRRSQEISTITYSSLKEYMSQLKS